MCWTSERRSRERRRRVSPQARQLPLALVVASICETEVEKDCSMGAPVNTPALSLGNNVESNRGGH
jgi:hypothetical protein